MSESRTASSPTTPRLAARSVVKPESDAGESDGTPTEDSSPADEPEPEPAGSSAYASFFDSFADSLVPVRAFGAVDGPTAGPSTVSPPARELQLPERVLNLPDTPDDPPPRPTRSPVHASLPRRPPSPAMPRRARPSPPPRSHGGMPSRHAIAQATQCTSPLCFVGGMSVPVDHGMVKRALEPFGTVVVLDEIRGRGCALLEMDSVDSARAAILASDPAHLGGGGGITMEDGTKIGVSLRVRPSLRRFAHRAANKDRMRRDRGDQATAAHVGTTAGLRGSADAEESGTSTGSASPEQCDLLATAALAQSRRGACVAAMTRTEQTAQVERPRTDVVDPSPAIAELDLDLEHPHHPAHLGRGRR